MTIIALMAPPDRLCKTSYVDDDDGNSRSPIEWDWFPKAPQGARIDADLELPERLMRESVAANLARPYNERLITWKAKRLAQQYNFTISDKPDIEQELRIQLWRKATQFDRRRSHWKAFAKTVIERHVARLVERRQVLKRGLGEVTISLDQEMVRIDDEEQLVALAQLVSARDLARRTGFTSPSVNGIYNFEMRHDVDLVLKSLPPAQAAICDRLRRESLRSVARSLGIPNSTLRGQLREIRAAFEAAGFQDFGRRRRARVPSSGR